MYIKTTDGEHNVASQAVGGTGLGLGIAGTALALLNGNGNALLGGLFGGGNSATISTLQAELAKEKAERYADSIGIATFKEAKTMSDKNDEKIQANYIELAKAVAALDKQVAVDKQAMTDNLAFVNSRIDQTKNEVLCYCNATFVPGKLVMPLSSICPEAMQRYNSWTAPTAAASATEGN